MAMRLRKRMTIQRLSISIQAYLQRNISKRYLECQRIKLYGGGENYFTEFLKPSRGFICWDKRKEEKYNNDFADCELAWMNPELGNARVFRFLYSGFFTDCKEYEKRMHPNQKPIELYEWCLRNFAKEGWKILDTHAGSASSLIACHNLGFDAWGYEIDKEFYLKAKARLDEHTAQISFIV